MKRVVAGDPSSCQQRQKRSRICFIGLLVNELTGEARATRKRFTLYTPGPTLPLQFVRRHRPFGGRV